MSLFLFANKIFFGGGGVIILYIKYVGGKRKEDLARKSLYNSRVNVTFLQSSEISRSNSDVHDAYFLLFLLDFRQHKIRDLDYSLLHSSGTIGQVCFL